MDTGLRRYDGAEYLASAVLFSWNHFINYKCRRQKRGVRACQVLVYILHSYLLGGSFGRLELSESFGSVKADAACYIGLEWFIIKK
ncbi:MAG: hypothetical protein LBV79_10010 [Candidatus Adiutrix sp.]|nr:hypothetical protein [Candidatus Adiutrix sp.]